MGEIVKNAEIDLNSVSARLKELEKETNYPITQVNGQRIFGPPLDWGAEKPPRGSEIFVGKLPRDIFEDDLYPILSTYGRLYKMRLMLEFSGVNRGFAFVTYSSPEEAKLAVEKLNRFEIIPNHKILAFISIDNCRLFVANIPCVKTVKEIFYHFKQIMDGLEAVVLSPTTRGRVNKGFAFLEFDCHKNALEVRKRYWPYNLKLWNRKLFVDWAIPNHLKSQCKQLLLKGLTPKITSEGLANAIYARLRHLTLLGLKIRGTEAVITFRTRGNASEAYQKLRGLSIDGTPLSIFYKYPEEFPIHDSNKESDTSLPPSPIQQGCPNNNSLKLFKLPQNRPLWVPPIYPPLQQARPPICNYNSHSFYSTFQSKQLHPNYSMTPRTTLYYPSNTAHFTPYSNHYAYQQPWFSNNVRFFQPHYSMGQFWYPCNSRPILTAPLPTKTMTNNVTNVSDKKMSELNNYGGTEEIQKCLKIYPNNDQDDDEELKETDGVESDSEGEIIDHNNSTFTL